MMCSVSCDSDRSCDGCATTTSVWAKDMVLRPCFRRGGFGGALVDRGEWPRMQRLLGCMRVRLTDKGAARRVQESPAEPRRATTW